MNEFRTEGPKKLRATKPWENPTLRRQTHMKAQVKSMYFRSLINLKLIRGTGMPVSNRDTDPPGTTSTGSPIHSKQSGVFRPQKDDIRIEYHEKSGRAAKMSRFEDYCVREPVKVQPLPYSLASDSKPWSPFKSLADFEFAEVALEAALNKTQIEKLIKITKRCINGDDVFNLVSHKEVCETWNDASAMVSPVSGSYIFQALPIINNSLSSRDMSWLHLTKVTNLSSISGAALFGTGFSILSAILFWRHILNGMPKNCSNTMGQTLCASSMNPGLQTDFGMFR